MIIIKNLRNEKPTHEWQVRVDRTSVLGNPFKMQSENERDLVCDKYIKYITSKILERDKAILGELKRLIQILLIYGKIELFCWCVPKRCHAETIKKILERGLEDD
mgnify:FL=1